MSDLDDWLTNETPDSREDRSIQSPKCAKCGATSGWFVTTTLNATVVRVCERCVETHEKEGTNDSNG